MSRVLIVATDPIARTMAGPSIRCLEMGRQLARHGHGVTIVAPGQDGRNDGGPTLLATPSASKLYALAGQHDAVLVQGFALRDFPHLGSMGRPLVVDLYDPFPFALLHQYSSRSPTIRDTANASVLRSLREMLAQGDFFLCASERQRDLWMGALLAEGRVNPSTWSADRSLRNLLAVVPFGVPDVEPRLSGPGLRRAIPGIDPSDIVLLWGGGLYDWFDPLTLVQAIAVARLSEPRLRLVFMSTTHPNPSVPSQMAMPARTRSLADSLHLTDKHVFFHDTWVPYDERQNWLLAADCGVSTHLTQAETRYSFRTRLLDYVWASLPIIATDGDVLAETIRERGLGWVVPPGAVEPLAQAIGEMAANSALRARRSESVAEYATEIRWSRVVGPLLEYCTHPTQAPDHDATGSQVSLRGRPRSEGLMSRRQLVRTGVLSVRTRGPRKTLRLAVRYLLRRGNGRPK